MIWKKQPVGSKLADLQNNKASKDAATQSAAGLMSASDKTKLDGVATGATAVSVVDNLNSDSTTSALSAAQGKALNSKFTRNSVVFTLTSGLFSSANSYAVIEKAGFCLAVIDATVGSSNIPAWTKIGTSPVDKTMDAMVTVYDASHLTMTPCSYAAWDTNGISLPIVLTAGARYIIRVFGI